MKKNILFRLLFVITFMTMMCSIGLAQNHRVEGSIRSLEGDYYFGDNDNDMLYAKDGIITWAGSSGFITKILLRDKNETLHGGLCGNTGDGTRFGILDGNGNFIFRALKGNHTALFVSNSEKLRVQYNGNVGIGTISPSYTLDVNGSARVTSLSQSSDKRFKKDIKKIDNAMDKINALDGLTYKFKEGKIGEHDFSTLKGQKQLGFLAQDIKEVFPELVSEDQDGYLSVNYIGLIPVLVEGMKEQEEIIVEQKEEIADLQSRMERLEALLNTPSEDTRGSLPISVEDVDTGIVLRQNAPNPFSDQTTIEYQLPDELKAASLIVSDFNGRVVATYSISGKGTVEFSAKGLDSGTYAYTIIANGKSIAGQKMVVQK